MSDLLKPVVEVVAESESVAWSGGGGRPSTLTWSGGTFRVKQGGRGNKSCHFLCDINTLKAEGVGR